MENIIKDSKTMSELFTLLGEKPKFMYEDTNMNESINNAFFLENHAQQIVSTGRYTLSDVLYSRFYWYTKFLARYKTTFGANGSMEQAQFKIIEALDLALEEEVNSDLLESIEAELEYTDG